MTAVSRAVMPLRRWTAPVMARVASALLRSNLLSTDQKIFIWQIADRYISWINFNDWRYIINGQKLLVHPRFRVENEIFYMGQWEPSLTGFILGLGKLGGVFLDVGANIGYYSILSARVFDEIHAIEASGITFSRLQENINVNGFDNIHLHNFAVADRVCTLKFYYNGAHPGASSITAMDHAIPEVVEGKPPSHLFSLVDINRIRLIKIDIKGHEALILNYIMDNIDDFSCDLMVIYEQDVEKLDAWRAAKRFESAGFELFKVQSRYDRREYFQKRSISTLQSIKKRPEVFCDILIARRSTMPNGPKGATR